MSSNRWMSWTDPHLSSLSCLPPEFVHICQPTAPLPFDLPSTHHPNANILSGVSRNSRSRSFLRMEASDSRSRISGTDFFHSLPVPEFREWIFSIPFPFPNWPFQSRESKGKMGHFKRCLYSNIFSFLYISYKIKMGVLKSMLHICEGVQSSNILSFCVKKSYLSPG